MEFMSNIYPFLLTPSTGVVTAVLLCFGLSVLFSPRGPSTPNGRGAGRQHSPLDCARNWYYFGSWYGTQGKIPHFFRFFSYLEQRLLNGSVVLLHDEVGQALPEYIPWVDACDPLERARGVPELRPVVQAVDRHHVRALFHNEAEHLAYNPCCALLF